MVLISHSRLEDSLIGSLLTGRNGENGFLYRKVTKQNRNKQVQTRKSCDFFLGVKSRISKEENSNKKEVLFSTEEGGEATFLRESKTGTKVSSKILSIIFVFSFYLFYNTVRCVFVRSFVCLFVCLFVKCAYAREETCASSSFAGTCNPSYSTKRHKEREKGQKTRASSSFAGTCSPSNNTKRHKKGEKQQKTRASSSFAGYSTRFRGTFSLFLVRKTLKNDFTHWNIVQMKIFQGFYSRISRSERWVFFFWFKFDFFPLQGAFFCSFRPYFSTPKKQPFSVSALFLSPPETPVYYSRNTSLLFTKPPPEEEKSTTKGEASTTHTSKESYA